MLLALYTTQVKKECTKKILKKIKKGFEKFVFRGFEPGPSELVRTKS